MNCFNYSVSVVKVDLDALLQNAIPAIQSAFERMGWDHSAVTEELFADLAFTKVSLVGPLPILCTMYARLSCSHCDYTPVRCLCCTTMYFDRWPRMGLLPVVQMLGSKQLVDSRPLCMQ